MSWDDHRKRRAALLSVLDYAERNPAAGLPFEQLPDVPAVFGDRSQLLLAMQYRWSQALWARVELLSMDTHLGALTDADTLAAAAWEQCSAQHPVLRRLLDQHLAEVGRDLDAVRMRERSVIVAAGIGHTAQAQRVSAPYVA